VSKIISQSLYSARHRLYTIIPVKVDRVPLSSLVIRIGLVQINIYVEDGWGLGRYEKKGPSAGLARLIARSDVPKDEIIFLSALIHFSLLFLFIGPFIGGIW
jgi:hypothetical protein